MNTNANPIFLRLCSFRSLMIGSGSTNMIKSTVSDREPREMHACVMPVTHLNKAGRSTPLSGGLQETAPYVAAVRNPNPLKTIKNLHVHRSHLLIPKV